MELGGLFTVSLWVKPSDVSSLSYFVYGSGIGVWEEPGPVGTVQLGLAVSLPSTNSAGAPVLVNTWVHFTGTYDGANIRCYINGVLQATTAWPGTGFGVLSNMRIGKGAGAGWSGSIGDLRFYNRALSQAEITALFNGTM